MPNLNSQGTPCFPQKIKRRVVVVVVVMVVEGASSALGMIKGDRRTSITTKPVGHGAVVDLAVEVEAAVFLKLGLSPSRVKADVAPTLL